MTGLPSTARPTTRPPKSSSPTSGLPSSSSPASPERDSLALQPSSRTRRQRKTSLIAWLRFSTSTRKSQITAGLHRTSSSK
jgi:hypothetical protein